MANKLYEESNIQAIADAIRAKGQSGTMTVAQMPSKIAGIKTKSTYTWNQCPTAVRNYLNYLAQNPYNPSDYTYSKVGSYRPAADVSSPVGITVDGVTYYNEVPNVETPFSSANEAGTVKPLDKLRWIKLDNVHNVRDLGGWSCDGGTIKYGKLFRGRELSGEKYPALSNADKVTLRDYLGISAELDLRSATDVDYDNDDPTDDIATSPINADYLRVPIVEYTGISLANEAENSKYVIALNWLMDKAIQGVPLYFHCIHGKDRTGTIAWLVEGMLGVSQSDMDTDYELSSFLGNDPIASPTRLRTRTDYIALVNYIGTMQGATLRDKVVDWAIKSGITLEKINAFRYAMIDGNPATLTYSLPVITVTPSLKNITIDNETAKSYQAYRATLTPSAGKEIKNVSIEMGGTDISASVLTLISYPLSLGKISIPKVNGNIVINADTGARLPDAYQEVTYIEASGTQYIDTGVVSTAPLSVKFKMAYTGNVAANSIHLFGSNDAASHRFSIGKTSGYAHIVLSANSTAAATADVFAQNEEFTVEASWADGNSWLKQNGKSLNGLTTSGFNNEFTHYIFCRNNKGVANGFAPMRIIGDFDMTQNGTLVRKFVPCYRKADNVIGLYDMVNNVFYTNQGTGVFTKGANI